MLEPNYTAEDVATWSNGDVLNEYLYLSGVAHHPEEFRLVRAEGIKRGFIHPETHQII